MLGYPYMGNLFDFTGLWYIHYRLINLATLT